MNESIQSLLALKTQLSNNLRSAAQAHTEIDSKISGLGKSLIDLASRIKELTASAHSDAAAASDLVVAERRVAAILSKITELQSEAAVIPDPTLGESAGVLRSLLEDHKAQLEVSLFKGAFAEHFSSFGLTEAVEGHSPADSHAYDSLAKLLQGISPALTLTAANVALISSAIDRVMEEKNQNINR